MGALKGTMFHVHHPEYTILNMPQPARCTPEILETFAAFIEALERVDPRPGHADWQADAVRYLREDALRDSPEAAQRALYFVLNDGFDDELIVATYMLLFC